MNALSKLPFSQKSNKSQVLHQNMDAIFEMYQELTEDGNLKLVSGKEWRKYGKNNLGVFCNLFNIWTIPTTELIDILDKEIDNLSCIEICAGLGLISKELSIKATDSYLHATDEFKSMANRINITGIIEYPSEVEKLEASEAVDKYHPECVLGCYAIPKWTEEYAKKYFLKTNKDLPGSICGVDYDYICQHIKRLILVGHKDLYCQYPFWKRPHKTIINQNIITRYTVNGLSSVYVFNL